MSEALCPTCDRNDFDSEHAMKIHHWKAHGESIAGVKVACDFCGDILREEPARVEEYNHHFCDRECRAGWDANRMSESNNQNWKGGPIIVECSWCGDEITMIRRHRAQNQDHFFCDMKNCFAEWLASQPDQSVEVRCTSCGNTLKRAPYEVEKSRRFFCNSRCAGDWLSSLPVSDPRFPGGKGPNAPSWKGGKVEIKCVVCGDTAMVDPYRKESAKFCSPECFQKWNSKRTSEMTGENHPRWKGGYEPYYGPNWRNQRRKALERDGYRCQECGKSETDLGREPSVHHRVRLGWFKDEYDAPEWYEKGNALGNLITLCQTHHGKWESLPVQPEVTAVT